MRRREFISMLGGAVAWPLAARAQQPDRVRRIGVLMNTVSDDAEGQARLAAFHQGLQQSTRTVPVVFVNVADPVGAGFVESLAHPAGNITGFGLFEFGLSAKWLELLKEVAPGVTRVAGLRDL